MLFAVLEDSGDALVQCLFDFFMTAPSKTCVVDTSFGKTTSQHALEKYDSVRDIPQKVETSVAR